MPKLFLPPAARSLADGQQSVTAAGETVREVLNAVEEQHPGVRAKLMDGDQVRGGLAIIIDNKPCPLGLETRVSAETQIHFLPPIAGG